MAPVIADFRQYSFQTTRVERAGKFLGRSTYWRLYAIENLIRVLIHSVLSGQQGPNWWAQAVDANIQGKAQRFRQTYLQSPWHTNPGTHDIYLVFLSDLNEIIRANSNLFVPLIRDIDQWMARIEQIRIPRNIIGHMNFLNRNDRSRIDIFHTDLLALISQLQNRGLVISIP